MIDNYILLDVYLVIKTKLTKADAMDKMIYVNIVIKNP